jgi:hypothetical protein
MPSRVTVAVLVPLLASSVAACGWRTPTSTHRVVDPSPNRSHTAGPPRYHACGWVFKLSYAPSPVYAHNVTCAVAKAVVRRCSGANRVCFGEFALPYNGVGEPSLPQAPAFKPLGFECWQAFPAYAAGLPPPPTTIPDPKPILCAREASLPGPNLVGVQQLVAYVV